MTSSEIPSDIEMQSFAALAKYDSKQDMTDDERYAFRMGFMAGTRHGLDLARHDMMEILK